MFPLSLRRIHDFRILVDNLETLQEVKDNIEDVSTVAGISEDITTVADIKVEVETTSDNSSAITTIHDNISEILDLSYIDIINDNIADITSCADNISAITDAPVQALAAQSAANTALGLVNLSGSSSIFIDQTVLYTITNFNLASTYSVSISAGSVSRNGYFISITAPSSAQTVTLTVIKDSHSSEFSIVVNDTGILTPTNLYPSNGQPNVTDTLILSSSAFFTVGYSDTHDSSDWILATDAAFSNIVQSLSASSSHKTTWTVTNLEYNTTYYWKIRYRGASTTVSEWSATTSFSTLPLFTGDIGIPGTVGFGVGVCLTIPEGIAELTGTQTPSSNNYGNYQYTDGSIMCWIPAFYYKWGTGSNDVALNDVDIKNYREFASVEDANLAGYALHRAFYDGGVVKTGFFVDKYQCSNNSGTASSIKNGNPLSSNGAHNPFSGLSGTQYDFYYGAVVAAKTRGANFFCSSKFIFAALALLSYAHAKASTGTTNCAWYDAAGIVNFPKGNNSNGLADVNDTSVHWQSDGYSNCGKTGSAGYGGGTGNVFAKSTHNGQDCGVADLNGNMWEITPGLTSNGTNLYVLKTSATMKNLTGGNSASTDLWGAAGISTNYDDLGTSYGAWTGVGNALTYGSATQVFSEATSGNAWNVASAGIPLVGGTGGTNAFGNDVLYNFKANECCPISGGSWYDAAYAGVWGLSLNLNRSYSYGYVGFRSALYL